MNDKNEMEKFFPPEEKNVDNDYKYSRDTYYELVEKGKQSLELMIEVARESEHPRAFEVLSWMIKNISDVYDKQRVYGTEILSASIRGVKAVSTSFALGAHVVTMPPSVFEKMYNHVLTDKGLQLFDADWASVVSNTK